MNKKTIEEERKDSIKALNDPNHPHYTGVIIFCKSYNNAPEIRDFMKKIAPYMFREDGSPIWRSVDTVVLH